MRPAYCDSRPPTAPKWPSPTPETCGRCRSRAVKPGEFDPRKYLGPARDEMKKLYMHKIINVLGSNGKAE